MFWSRAAQDSCTRAVHCASVRTGLSNLHTPPYRSRQIICLSHSRVRSPSPPIADAALPSPATCRAVPSRARVHAQQHTSSHTVRCARLVHLFWRNILTSSSGLKSKSSNKQEAACSTPKMEVVHSCEKSRSSIRLHGITSQKIVHFSSKELACCLLGILFHSKNGGSMVLQNVGELLLDYMASHPRQQYSL
jgi:hypothetical protein